MKKNFSKIYQEEKKVWKTPKNKAINRSWGTAARMEHHNISGKKGKHHGDN